MKPVAVETLIARSQNSPRSPNLVEITTPFQVELLLSGCETLLRYPRSILTPAFHADGQNQGALRVRIGHQMLDAWSHKQLCFHKLICEFAMKAPIPNKPSKFHLRAGKRATVKRNSIRKRPRR